MKTVGIIAEYNPFHNGHLYHIEKAKELTGADYCVVVMSGDFLQRGEPALMDKYSRTEMALAGGADLVLELPVYYATASAEYFASAAVSLLAKSGVTDAICFGSESADSKRLDSIASVLADEPEEYRLLLKDELTKGQSFPVSRAAALYQFFLKNGSLENAPKQLQDILNSPNDILGIEYLKAIKRLNSSIVPIALPRITSGYHDTQLKNGISSATAIRKEVAQTYPAFADALMNQLPSSTYQLMKAGHKKNTPIYLEDFSLLLHYRLLQFTTAEELMVFFDVGPDLALRIFRLKSSYKDYASFIDELSSRQWTTTRIQRALLHILLDIRTTDVKHAVSEGYGYYLRILGFRKEAQPLLSALKANSSLPLITKLAAAPDILNHPCAISMLHKDIKSASIYHSVLSGKYQAEPYNEYQKQLIIR